MAQEFAAAAEAMWTAEVRAAGRGGLFKARDCVMRAAIACLRAVPTEPLRTALAERCGPLRARSDELCEGGSRLCAWGVAVVHL